jgi:hypothetical protein
MGEKLQKKDYDNIGKLKSNQICRHTFSKVMIIEESEII